MTALTNSLESARGQTQFLTDQFLTEFLILLRSGGVCGEGICQNPEALRQSEERGKENSLSMT